ncbi:ryncolin-4-like [Drosophila innubila]|uniref:ryncolin-4-like n=1 Tax=Drosophila innubila TaxID=198719 RepID=UPI00148D6C9F|nr:ryncolin-4-like [Drosophila innubila]
MNGSVNFYRNWTEYKNGFGNLSGEFFMGLDKLSAMTAARRQELIVILEDYDNDEKFVTYDHFAIGNETEQYSLNHLGLANGTAGNSLSWEFGNKFSTFDRDNSYNEVNCAKVSAGAWWYDRSYCHIGQLTGLYNATSMVTGMNWYTFWTLTFSLKRAVMMIRPKM